jgi:hypothetical protein
LRRGSVATIELEVLALDIVGAWHVNTFTPQITHRERKPHVAAAAAGGIVCGPVIADVVIAPGITCIAVWVDPPPLIPIGVARPHLKEGTVGTALARGIQAQAVFHIGEVGLFALI